jgi:sterol desaturase/sphingolipid hydroxylase (fatty acid hydroxylase superfamily)
MKIRHFKVNDRGGYVSMLSAIISLVLENIATIFLYYALTYWFYTHRIFELGFHWYVWVFCFLLHDFIVYWAHRLQHEVRLLWCFHSVHHTPDEMRITTAIRGSIFDFLCNPWFFVWVGLLGIHPLMFIIVTSIAKTWGALQHVNESFVGKLPILNKIFITPDVHRVHHGKNIQYLDRNYAELLSIWDRVFGTYEEYDEKPDYGIIKDINPDNFKQIHFDVWIDLWKDLKQTDNWIDKVKILIKPPGWTPDGKGYTTKQLKLLKFNEAIKNLEKNSDVS